LNFAAFSSFTYTSIWLQSVMGLSPLQAGLTGLPLAACSFLVSALIGRFLHGLTSPGLVIGGGLLLIGAGGLLCALLMDRGSSWPALLPGFAVAGVGVGLATPTLSSSAMAAVPVVRGGMAAGAVNTARQLGFAVGIAVLGSVFAAQAADALDSQGPDSGVLAHDLASGQAQALLARSGAQRATLDAALHAASTSAMREVFLVAGLVGVLAGLVVLLLVRAPRPPGGPPDPAGEPVAAPMAT
ncbi:MAG: Major facilitator permease, partial [Frankiales bacterium]|nr:Major facilitator permease [Frankiales bacterium]